MQVILISGKAQHGKDTVAKMLKNKFVAQGKKVLITRFADLLKFICKNYFGWDGKKNEAGRSILQYVGTDVIRNKMPNYWVDFIKNLLGMFRDEWDVVLIPDTRFKNEVHWEEEWDTITVRVNRKDFVSPLTLKQQLHPSETDLDNYYFDYTISSNSLAMLKKEVDKFIKWMEDNNDLP